METIIKYALQNIHLAPWIVAICVLLAGLNLPFSIDVILALCAFIAANLSPKLTLPLYMTFLISSILSAWIAYSLGRFVSHKVQQIPLIKKVVTPKRVDQMNIYYSKFGPWIYILGRFIPFGIRNAIFMTSGMTKVKFLKFALLDLVGCIIWSSLFYILFFQLSTSLPELIQSIKHINLLIFIGFSVTIIAFICYKYTMAKKNINQ